MAADTFQTGFTAASSDGVTSAMRGGRLNDLIISQHSPRFAEHTIRGKSYSAAITTTGTVAAGNITGASAAGSTQFALWNPANTGVNVVLKRLIIGLNSGTPAGGPILHNIFSGALPTIASVGTAGNNLVGTTYSGQARFVLSAGGTTLTGGSALTFLRPSTISFSATAYSAPGGSAHFEDIDGDIILPPGTGWVPCWAAAGTTVLNSWGITWSEFPI